MLVIDKDTVFVDRDGNLVSVDLGKNFQYIELSDTTIV